MPGKSTGLRKFGSNSRTVLDDELIQQICAFVVIGSTYEVAARACGVTTQTFYNWRTWGERDAGEEKDSVFARLFYALNEADAEGETRHVLNVAKNARNGTGSMWILQRRHPDRWGDSQRVEMRISQEMDRMLDVLREGLTDEEYVKVVALLVGSGE